MEHEDCLIPIVIFNTKFQETRVPQSLEDNQCTSSELVLSRCLSKIERTMSSQVQDSLSITILKTEQADVKKRSRKSENPRKSCKTEHSMHKNGNCNYKQLRPKRPHTDALNDNHGHILPDVTIQRIAGISENNAVGNMNGNSVPIVNAGRVLKKPKERKTNAVRKFSGYYQYLKGWNLMTADQKLHYQELAATQRDDYYKSLIESAVVAPAELMQENENIQQAELPQENENVQQDELAQENENVQQDELPQEDENVQQDELAQENENVQQDELMQENENVQQDELMQENENVQQAELAQENENVQQDPAFSNQIENVILNLAKEVQKVPNAEGGETDRGSFCEKFQEKYYAYDAKRKLEIERLKKSAVECNQKKWDLLNQICQNHFILANKKQEFEQRQMLLSDVELMHDNLYNSVSNHDKYSGE